MAEEACSDILLQKKITTRQDHVILQVIVAVYSNLARFHTRVPYHTRNADLGRRVKQIATWTIFKFHLTPSRIM